MTGFATKFLPPPEPMPRPVPMPPPEPPPKPLEEPPAIAPEIIEEADAEFGMSGRAMEAEALLEVMRVVVLASDLTFFGLILCWVFLTRSPPEPPPAPVANWLGSFLALSVTVETTKAAAMKMSKAWKAIDTERPLAPMRCQKDFLARLVPRISSVSISLTGTGGTSPGGGVGVSSLIVKGGR